MLNSVRDRITSLRPLLCVMALGTMLASSASAQVVEGYIQLPDSFGVFPAPYDVAWDYTPGEERLFVAGESSEVLVIDAISFQKLKRIPILARSICYSSAHDKLYIAELASMMLDVVDGSTYEVIKQVPLGDNAEWLFYNPIVDRVYCGTYHWRVIDCAGDSVVDTLYMGGAWACRAFDSAQNRLYVGTATGVNVVDCYFDSVVAAIPRVASARVLCYNSACDRVYAAANESLYAIDVTSDSVVDQSAWSPSLHTLCCDPTRNRIYGASLLKVAAWDCSTDTFLWARSFGPDSADGPKGLACVPDLDRVYVTVPLITPSIEGSTGDLVSSAEVDGRAAPPVYMDRPNRLYCFANWGQLAALDCGIDTAVGQVPLDAFVDGSAERVCLDTVMNKLYFAFNMPCGYVGAVDCSEKLVKSYQMCRYPGEMVHDPLDDKLYVSTWNGWNPGVGCVSVFDCGNDSLVKVIPTGYAKGGLRWHPQLNKVYSGVADSLGYYHVVVIDCATDSVVRMLARDWQDEEFHYSLLSTESNQFWGISPHGYTVVDCLNDSIVMDTIIDTWSPWGVCYSGDDRKVYVIRGSMPRELVVLSMKSLRPVKSVPFCRGTPEVVLNVPSVHKVYVAVLTSMATSDTVYAFDTRSDSIVSKFEAGHIIRAMCVDATGRYAYCTALKDHGSYVWSDTLLVIDTQRDSIVSGVNLPGVTLGVGEWLLPNRRTGRMYAGQGPNGKLLVIRDSVAVGVEEWRDTTDAPVLLQTVVSRTVPFRSPTRADLFDASGRRAAILRSGPNDISHLAPGVYFVRDTQAQAQAVQKIVLTR